MDDHKKTILITGASQGIGEGLVNAFLERGYNVVATSRHVSARFPYGGSDSVALVDGDIGDAETAKRIAEVAIERFGSINALVNNAGIFFSKPFVEYTPEDFRKLSSTNLEGFLHLTQLTVKRMLAQKSGGSIVSIGASTADDPIAGVNASVAMMTKGGIHAVSKSLAMEFARDGIRFNVVAPGIVDTPMHHGGGPMDFLKKLSPMGSISDIGGSSTPSSSSLKLRMSPARSCTSTAARMRANGRRPKGQASSRRLLDLVPTFDVLTESRILAAESNGPELPFGHSRRRENRGAAARNSTRRI